MIRDKLPDSLVTHRWTGLPIGTIAIILGFIGLSAFSLILFRFYQSSSIDGIPDRTTFRACVTDTTSLTNLDISDFRKYKSVWNLCSRQIYETFLDDDFAIRREKYRRQGLDERVNLWLVVTITVSGVILSGMQLIMSYYIATSGKEYWPNDTNFAIERGKISFRSSITGLAILGLSLAFFVVYVGWIYRNQTKEDSQALQYLGPIPTGNEISGTGGFGAPPEHENGKGLVTTPPVPDQQSKVSTPNQ